MRNLFNQLILANKPIVVHNGFLDLVFLYENLYCKLPDKLQVFTADLAEMFPAGVFDTKFVSEYSVREPASFLLYIFKKWWVCEKLFLFKVKENLSNNQSVFGWWSFPLFLWSCSMIL